MMDPNAPHADPPDPGTQPEADAASPPGQRAADSLPDPAPSLPPDLADPPVLQPPDADGKFSVAVGGNVVVPIFLTDENNYVLLPLSNAKIINATLSADHNCIGKYNADKLDPANQCLPPEFTNAASLDAYITLEDADTVPIESLGKSLCALLTKTDDGGTPKKCPRDAGTNKITSKGDWCSTTDAAATADCADAFKLGADFAASAVKITGDCK